MNDSNNLKRKARSIYELMDKMDVLESLPRTGYLIRGIRPCENVASHVFGTAFLAMLLADAEPELDSEKVLRMALLHEAGETLTGDIPLTAKRHFPDGAVKAADRSAAREILSGIADSAAYFELLEEFETCASREAKLVKAADKLQMLCKVRSYQRRGADNLDEFFINDQGMDLSPFPVAQALFELLHSLSPSAEKPGKESE